MKVEEVATQQVTFLDLIISKNGQWLSTEHLDISIHRKDTTLWQLLSHSSQHHPSVHAQWPRQMLRNWRKLYTSSRMYNKIASNFSDALKSRSGSLHPGLQQNKRQRHTDHRSAHPDAISTRIVLPAHNSLTRMGLTELLQKLTLRHRHLVGKIKFGIAWKNLTAHLQHKIRKLNKEYHEDSKEWMVVGDGRWDNRLHLQKAAQDVVQINKFVNESKIRCMQSFLHV